VLLGKRTQQSAHRQTALQCCTSAQWSAYPQLSQSRSVSRAGPQLTGAAPQQLQPGPLNAEAHSLASNLCILLIVKSSFWFCNGGALNRQVCLCSTAHESATAYAVGLTSGQVGLAGSASMQRQGRDSTLVMGKGKQSWAKVNSEE